jgi:hypothetical protein
VFRSVTEARHPLARHRVAILGRAVESASPFPDYGHLFDERSEKFSRKCRRSRLVHRGNPSRNVCGSGHGQHDLIALETERAIRELRQGLDLNIGVAIHLDDRDLSSISSYHERPILLRGMGEYQNNRGQKQHQCQRCPTTFQFHPWRSARTLSLAFLPLTGFLDAIKLNHVIRETMMVPQIVSSTWPNATVYE